MALAGDGRDDGSTSSLIPVPPYLHIAKRKNSVMQELCSKICRINNFMNNNNYSNYYQTFFKNRLMIMEK